MISMRSFSLVISALLQDMRGAWRRAKRNAFIVCCACICFLTAYVAALVAVAGVLIPLYGAVVSALLIASSMAGLGMLALLVLAALNAREKRRQSGLGRNKRVIAAAGLSMMPKLAQSKGLLSLAAIGGLAYLVMRPSGEDDGA